MAGLAAPLAVACVASDPPKPHSSASKRVVARAACIDAHDRLEMLETARPSCAPDSRPRDDRCVARAKVAPAAARKAVKRACA